MSLNVFSPVLLLLISSMVAQVSSKFESLSLSERSLYLVCSGSEQKQGLIAEQFNKFDKNATHVGIGIFNKKKLRIYNVDNTEEGNSALLIQDFQDFSTKRNTRYCSIWEYKSSKKEIKALKRILKYYRTKPILFDMDFDYTNDKFYCSEFCAKILQQWNAQLFSFSLTEKNLDSFYSSALNRSVLEYYPVDFFQVDTKFKKIYESHHR